MESTKYKVSMNIYSIADNIIGPLGINTEQNYEACLKGVSGIRKINNDEYYPEPFYGAAIDRSKLHTEAEIAENYTFLEQLFIHAISDVLSQVYEFDKKRTLLVISTTKGNIDLLSSHYKGAVKKERSGLSAMAQAIGQYFDIPNPAVVISNACISGLSAIITAKRFIEMGQYDHAIVAGGDILSEFVISGFQALKAISDEPCRPYDAQRKGISLGEACGAMMLSKDTALAKKQGGVTNVLAGSQTNDANHISGPSRTGEGLKLAITRSLQQAGISADDIDYINAHGTATIFNDEMEAIAFDTLGLNQTPLNSLKGYFGHTLGAAGVVEAIITMKQMEKNALVASKGFYDSGTTKPINVIKEASSVSKVDYALKTTSGFGGCNAAVIFKHVIV